MPVRYTNLVIIIGIVITFFYHFGVSLHNYASISFFLFAIPLLLVIHKSKMDKERVKPIDQFVRTLNEQASVHVQAMNALNSFPEWMRMIFKKYVSLVESHINETTQLIESFNKSGNENKGGYFYSMMNFNSSETEKYQTFLMCCIDCILNMPIEDLSEAKILSYLSKNKLLDESLNIHHLVVTLTKIQKESVRMLSLVKS